MSFGKVWSSRVFGILCGVGLVVSVTTASPDVFAQEVDVRRVLELIAQANDYFEAEAYSEALVAYKEAYAQYPDPSLLYRIGLTSERLNQNFDAVDYYARFIDAVPDDKTAKRVKERIDELRAQLPARYLIESNPSGATVYVGSSQNPAAGVTPAQVDVEPGAAVIVVDLEGYETEVRNLNAVRGEKSTLSLELREARVVVTPPPGATKPSEGVNLATWGWVTTGLGVATLATGGVFSFLSMSTTDDVNSYDKQAAGATREELNGMKDDAMFYYDTSIILYAAGGILTAAGATLLVIDLLSDDGHASITVSPTAGGASVGFGGSF